MILYGDLIQEVHPFMDNNNIIVHGTNCLGYMNSGIAKQIRDTYPQVFEVYRNTHQHQGLQLGFITTYNIGTLTIINANTQQFCQGYIHPDGTQEPYGNEKVFVDYDAIEACFDKVKHYAKALNAVVHYPKIGAGLANGDWDIIQERINIGLGEDVVHNLWIKE